MFRLVKIEEGKKEVLSAFEDENKTIEALKEYVFNHASNGYEYTACDFEAVAEQRYENIGSYKIEIDEVSTMSEKEFLACGGNVCIHCHSDEVEQGDLYMNEGYVTRDLTCEICGKETVEQYNLAGYED